MNDLSTALWISALGMGLVFGAIILLWAMMTLLTKLTADKNRAVDSRHTDSAPTDSDAARAAALAVAVALAKQDTSSARPLQQPPTAIVSAWQLGMRTRQQSDKGNFRRR